MHKTCVQSPKHNTWQYKKYIFKSDQFHELPCYSWCMVHNTWVIPWFMKRGSWYMGYWVVHDVWFMKHELPVSSLYNMVHDLHVGSWYTWFMIHELPVGSWNKLPVGSWYMSYLMVYDTRDTLWFMMHDLPHGSWCTSYLCSWSISYWVVMMHELPSGSWCISNWVSHDAVVMAWRHNIELNCIKYFFIPLFMSYLVVHDGP